MTPCPPPLIKMKTKERAVPFGTTLSDVASYEVMLMIALGSANVNKILSLIVSRCERNQIQRCWAKYLLG